MLLKYVDGIKVANVLLSLTVPQHWRGEAANRELTAGEFQVERRLPGYTENTQPPVWTFQDIICVCMYVYIFIYIICTIKQQIVWLRVGESSSLRWDQTDVDVCSVLLSASSCWGKIISDHFIHESRNNDRRVVKNNCLLISTFLLLLIALRWLETLCPHCAFSSTHLISLNSWVFMGNGASDGVYLCQGVCASYAPKSGHFMCLESPRILFLEDRLVLPTSPFHLSSVAHNLFSPRAIASFVIIPLCFEVSGVSRQEMIEVLAVSAKR